MRRALFFLGLVIPALIIAFPAAGQAQAQRGGRSMMGFSRGAMPQFRGTMPQFRGTMPRFRFDPRFSRSFTLPGANVRRFDRFEDRFENRFNTGRFDRLEDRLENRSFLQFFNTRLGSFDPRFGVFFDPRLVR